MVRKVIAFWLSLAMVFSSIVIVEVITDFAPTAEGTILYVNETGSGGVYSKIQNAINASKDGDTVFVYNGTYYENVVVNKSINLTGKDRNNTIIDGGGIGDVLVINANWVNITGFTIKGSGNGPEDNGMDLNSVHHCRIENNIVINNRYGIYLYYSNNISLINNNASSNNNGIWPYYSNYNVLINNTASNNYRGIYIYHSSNNILVNNTANLNTYRGIQIVFNSNHNILDDNTINSNYGYGIEMYSSDNNTLANSTISYNHGGLELEFSSRLKLINNTMIGDGIYIDGEIQHWNTHVIGTSNTVNGKPVQYWKDKNGGKIPQGAGQVILANCTDIIVENQNLSNGTTGICIGHSSNSTLISNAVTSNDIWGIYLRSSSDNTFHNNTVSSNERGILMRFSDNNSLSYNNVSDNQANGFWLIASNRNNIANHTISNNQVGINLFYSKWNNITRNLVSYNNISGIHIEDSSENCIYHNNLIDNTNQADDFSFGGNKWDNGYPSGGNYWSDYGGNDSCKGPNQNIQGSDGIGDTPYLFFFDSKDNYPLMEPYTYKPLENHTVLKQGWNLISIPLIQENQSLIKVLGMIDGWYDAVQWYDITDPNDPWEHHKVGKPFGNDLFEINETMGFWIHINRPGDTTFLYNGTQPMVNQTITLHPGWNLVGYPSLTSYNRTQGLNNLTFGTHVDSIWTYDAATQKWCGIGSSNYFEVGKGYWVHAKVKCTWEVPSL